ncbi:hypothetical protein BB341_12050 [Streptomyces clavuligerus]|nr:hypothetical protein BB341_12050 [Streptomyces clavuligerus]AXU13487.1 hypothetical protein D1794_12480 [Streptomyces clavuligerus]QCS06270.1 hypothetical protein CRV15_11915 [Streptomyces clavuligerus]
MRRPGPETPGTSPNGPLAGTAAASRWTVPRPRHHDTTGPVRRRPGPETPGASPERATGRYEDDAASR